MGAGVRDAFPPPMCVWRTLKAMWWKKYNPDGVMAHRVVWWGLVGAVPVCPPVSPCKGAFAVKSSCVNGGGEIKPVGLVLLAAQG